MEFIVPFSVAQVVDETKSISQEKSQDDAADHWLGLRQVPRCPAYNSGENKRSARKTGQEYPAFVKVNSIIFLLLGSWKF